MNIVHLLSWKEVTWDKRNCGALDDLISFFFFPKMTVWNLKHRQQRAPGSSSWIQCLGSSLVNESNAPQYALPNLASLAIVASVLFILSVPTCDKAAAAKLDPRTNSIKKSGFYLISAWTMLWKLLEEIFYRIGLEEQWLWLSINNQSALRIQSAVQLSRKRTYMTIFQFSADVYLSEIWTALHGLVKLIVFVFGNEVLSRTSVISLMNIFLEDQSIKRALCKPKALLCIRVVSVGTTYPHPSLLNLFSSRLDEEAATTTIHLFFLHFVDHWFQDFCHKEPEWGCNSNDLEVFITFSKYMQLTLDGWNTSALIVAFGLESLVTIHRFLVKRLSG